MKNEINGYLEKAKSIEEEKKKTQAEIQDLKGQMVKLEDQVLVDEEKKKRVQGTYSKKFEFKNILKFMKFLILNKFYFFEFFKFFR